MPGASEVRAGGAFIEVGGDVGGLDKVIAGIRKQFDQLGSSLRSVGRKMIITGAAITAGFIPAIQKAGAFQEIVSKFDAVFKEFAGAAREWTQEYATAMGRSKSQLFSFMATLQDTFVPLGFARDKAMEMSKTLTELTIDLASFNDQAEPMVLRDLQSAIVGNHETMRKYGVIITQTGLDQELLNMGFADGARKASEQMKAQARLNIILQGTSDAQGDAARTAGSYANVKRRLTAQVENLAIAIGEHLLPVVTPMIQKITLVIERAHRWVLENRDLVVGLFKLGTALTLTGTGLVGLGMAVQAVGKLFSPTGLLIAGITLLLAKSVDLGKMTDRFNEWVSSIEIGGKSIVDWFFKLSEIWDQILPIWEAGTKALLAVFQEFWSSIKIGFQTVMFDILSEINNAIIKIYQGLEARLRGAGLGKVERQIIKGAYGAAREISDVIYGSTTGVLEARTRERERRVGFTEDRKRTLMIFRDVLGFSIKRIREIIGESFETVFGKVPTAPAAKEAKAVGLPTGITAPRKADIRAAGTFAAAAVLGIAVTRPRIVEEAVVKTAELLDDYLPRIAENTARSTGAVFT